MRIFLLIFGIAAFAMEGRAQITEKTLGKDVFIYRYNDTVVENKRNDHWMDFEKGCKNFYVQEVMSMDSVLWKVFTKERILQLSKGFALELLIDENGVTRQLRIILPESNYLTIGEIKQIEDILIGDSFVVLENICPDQYYYRVMKRISFRNP